MMMTKTIMELDGELKAKEKERERLKYSPNEISKPKIMLSEIWDEFISSLLLLLKPHTHVFNNCLDNINNQKINNNNIN